MPCRLRSGINVRTRAYQIERMSPEVIGFAIAAAPGFGYVEAVAGIRRRSFGAWWSGW